MPRRTSPRTPDRRRRRCLQGPGGHLQGLLALASSLAMILVAAANTAGYALTSYMPTYLTESKGYDEVHGTLLTIPVLVIMSLLHPADRQAL